MTEARTAAQWWNVVEQLAARETAPELRQLARERVGWLLRLGPAPAEPDDAQLQAVSGFVDQFVIDVAGVTTDQRTALFGALGGSTLGFVQALYVTDLGMRRTVLRSRLLGDEVAVVEAGSDETLWGAIEEFMRVVARLGALDPLLSELVRLRGASMHACRLCQSRRSVEATQLEPAHDLLMIAEQFERFDLDDRTRVALRITDAMITQPTELADADAAVASELFTAAEIDELLFDVVRNAANKIAVAFGADAPQVTDGIELFTLDEQGDVVTVG